MHVDKKMLAIMLSRVPRFSSPKPSLEQYVSDPELVSEIVLRLILEGYSVKTASDFGCGTGMLTYAILFTGIAAYVVCVEIDLDAIRVARDFLASSGLDAFIDFVAGDARKPPLRHVELVIMNPPFGIRSRRGMDIEFLKSALRVADRIVSIHAWSDGLLRAITAKTGCEPRVLLYGWQRIPQFLEHHRRRSHRVKVVAVDVSRSECDEA